MTKTDIISFNSDKYYTLIEKGTAPAEYTVCYAVIDSASRQFSLCLREGTKYCCYLFDDLLTKLFDLDDAFVLTNADFLICLPCPSWVADL